jgi:LacI family transcriptional regulator
VARAAAVSTASASRALTRPEAVSDELRIRVSEAANTLGYVPNSAARALACRRSGSIGVVTGNLDDPGMAPALAALDTRLTDAGWDLLLGGGEDGTPLVGARALVSRGVGALVFLGVGVPSELREVRGIQRLPCVSVDRTDRTEFTASAGLDLGRAGKLIADYLEQLGHRRMAVVAEPRSVISALLVEALGAEKALDGSPLEVMHIGDEPIAEGILRWLARSNSPTAAICVSDAVALAVMHACACLGIAVPGRLSVIGFGDSPLARCVSPTLTSVRIPARAAGIAAAEYLLARFAGRIPGLAECPVKLAIRGSTGPPPWSL